jgi:hypothetical protein
VFNRVNVATRQISGEWVAKIAQTGDQAARVATPVALVLGLVIY